MEPYKKSVAVKELLLSVAGTATGWKGTAYRAVSSEYANSRDLLSGAGTKRYGGRWTPPGSFASVHASLDVATAIAEGLGSQKRYGFAVDARLPLTLVALDIELERLVDLTNTKVLAELGLSRQKLVRCRWRESMEKGREALTQALGRIAFEIDFEGLIVPSAQKHRGTNVVAFPENLHKGSSLTIQNVEKLPAPSD